MKILLCVDGSTRKVVDLTCEFAEKLNAKITIIHVVVLPVVGGIVGPIDPTPFRERGMEIIKKIKHDVEKVGLEASTHLETTIGNPAYKILKYAERESFDLIVVGAMGESRIKKLLLGSVSSTVTRNAKCPVLVLR